MVNNVVMWLTCFVAGEDGCFKKEKSKSKIKKVPEDSKVEEAIPLRTVVLDEPPPLPPRRYLVSRDAKTE